MNSMEDEFLDLLGELKRIGPGPDRQCLEQIPTILSPQRSTLADWNPRDENVIARPQRENQRGYERGR
ncbi:hypothetical protein [Nocardia sp. NPDC057272]|uniref:hypothetical protein n=1 Tax=Nocardia sp. NPDC057272 TaxID=3346079 RepID=UPI0036339BDA